MASKSKSYSQEFEYKSKYIESLSTAYKGEIAIETSKANEQHYEVNTDFMMSCLGKRAKYSCCLYETGKETLDQAEGESSQSSLRAQGSLTTSDWIWLNRGYA